MPGQSDWSEMGSDQEHISLLLAHNSEHDENCSEIPLKAWSDQKVIKSYYILNQILLFAMIAECLSILLFQILADRRGTIPRGTYFYFILFLFIYFIFYVYFYFFIQGGRFMVKSLKENGSYFSILCLIVLWIFAAASVLCGPNTNWRAWFIMGVPVG